MKPWNQEQRIEIYEEAQRLHYQFQHRIRGQTITEQDGLEYWVLYVAQRKFLEHLSKIRGYLELELKLFEEDPADSLYQSGYEAAIVNVLKEAL